MLLVISLGSNHGPCIRPNVLLWTRDQGPLRAGCWADSAVSAVFGVTFEGMCLYRNVDTRCVAQPRLLVLCCAWSWDDLLSLLSSCAGHRQMELLPNMLIISSQSSLALRNI